MNLKEKVLDKFLRYVKIDTQSDPNSDTVPSTQKQFDLARMLKQELIEMGAKDVLLTDQCYLYATVPSNTQLNSPSIGFCSHVDTSPDESGTNVNPQVIESYDGTDIKLGESGKSILVDENPALETCLGHTIVHTDGTTLLGSDDKSGIAAIMTAAEIILADKSIANTEMKICFTPDEEIGRGADHFDINGFGCQYCYTIDGEMPGQLNKETFSADSAFIRVTGREIHPGSAKDIMVNSTRVIASIITKLPMDMAPETTDGYQPYIHPHVLKSEVGKAELMLLLRDFDTDGLAVQKSILEKIIKDVSLEFPNAKIELDVKKSYRNMLEYLEKNPVGMDFLFQAAKKAGVNPYWAPIRGGTDGSRLSEMGLPTPNIFTGGQNFHSVTEWNSIDSLVKAVETIINLTEIWGKSNN